MMYYPIGNDRMAWLGEDRLGEVILRKVQARVGWAKSGLVRAGTSNRRPGRRPNAVPNQLLKIKKNEKNTVISNFAKNTVFCYFISFCRTFCTIVYNRYNLNLSTVLVRPQGALNLFHSAREVVNKSNEARKPV